MEYVIAFDFSVKSTGVVVLPRVGTPVPLWATAIKTEWAGSQWWAPQRYLAFFRDLDAFMAKVMSEIREQHTTPPECYCQGYRHVGHCEFCGSLPSVAEHSIDLAAEAVVWDKESTPALFALHTRFWEWAWKWRTRMAYFTYQRWRNLLIERHRVEKAVAEIEGKGVAMRLYKEVVGRQAQCNDISDAWGVGTAACRLYNFLDGRLTYDELSPKERQFFDSTRKVKGLTTKVGIANELNTNLFDWRGKDGQESG